MGVCVQLVPFVIVKLNLAACVNVLARYLGEGGPDLKSMSLG